MDELNKQLRLVFKQLKGVSKGIHLVDKVDKSPCAARHESAHHPFVLVSRRQVALDEQHDRQWESGACDIVLPIIGVEY